MEYVFGKDTFKICLISISELYDKLNEPTDEEYDMLDLAFGLTETLEIDFFFIGSKLFTLVFRSRLGCQIRLSPAFEGVSIKLPQATRNMAVDGFKPKPH